MKITTHLDNYSQGETASVTNWSNTWTHRILIIDAHRNEICTCVRRKWGPTRWSTALSSKVNVHHAIDFRVLCGANLVTLRSKF